MYAFKKFAYDTPMVKTPSLKKPAQRWAAIKAQLELRGLSLAEIGRRIGLTRAAVYAARHHRYPTVERAIADALGLRPQQIWPERYNAAGLPLRRRPNAPFERPNQRRKTTEV